MHCLLRFMLAILSSSLSATSASPSHPSINLRLPPTLATTPDSAWVGPAPSWLYGNWKITYSSRPTYHTLYNFQHDAYPLFPTVSPTGPGTNIDLTSFNLAPHISNTTYTAFGYDTPLTALAPWVYRFNGTGLLSSVSNVWQMLAWGRDSAGIAYRVEYETAAPGEGGDACVNFLSRNEDGPSEETLAEIWEGLGALVKGNSALEGIVGSIQKMTHDGRRTGVAPVACDEDCMMNAGLAEMMAAGQEKVRDEL